MVNNLLYVNHFIETIEQYLIWTINTLSSLAHTTQNLPNYKKRNFVIEQQYKDLFIANVFL